MNAIQCCHGCMKRHLGCHGHCPEYLEAKAKQDARREAAIKKKLIGRAMNDVQWHGKRISDRKKGKK